MTSFQDAPDENIEHDEKMELRSSLARYLFRNRSNRFLLQIIFDL